MGQGVQEAVSLLSPQQTELGHTAPAPCKGAGRRGPGATVKEEAQLGQAVFLRGLCCCPASSSLDVAGD